MERIQELISKPYAGQLMENSRNTTPHPNWDGFWDNFKKGCTMPYCIGFLQRSFYSPQGSEYWNRIYIGD